MSTFKFWVSFCIQTFAVRLYGGDGGSSSQETSTTTNNTTNVADRRAVADSGSIIATEGSSVVQTVTDLGAIQKASDLAQAAILGATKTASENNAQAGKLAAQSLDLAKGLTVELKGAYESGAKFLTVAGLIGAGVLILSSGKK